MTGTCKGFFGFKVFNFRIFLCKNILASTFWSGLGEVPVDFFGGVQNNMKKRGKELLPCVVYTYTYCSTTNVHVVCTTKLVVSFNPFWVFFKVRKNQHAIGIFWVRFWFRGFDWVLLEALGIFGGFDFFPIQTSPPL